MARPGAKSVAAKISGCLLLLQRKATKSFPVSVTAPGAGCLAARPAQGYRGLAWPR